MAILLADNSMHTRRMGVAYLSGLGYEVEAVADATAALTALAAHPPSLILVDAALPGLGAALGGMELCRRVKSDPALRSIPVLVMVGALARVEAAALAGCDGILRKPLSSAGLERWLSGAATASPVTLTPTQMLERAVQEAALGR